jgi:hypothetical protein
MTVIKFLTDIKEHLSTFTTTYYFFADVSFTSLFYYIFHLSIQTVIHSNKRFYGD